VPGDAADQHDPVLGVASGHGHPVASGQQLAGDGGADAA
jgi:hypothetical protein